MRYFKTRLLLFVLVAVASFHTPVSGSGYQKGILFDYFEMNGVLRGEPGQIIFFMDKGDMLYDIKIGGKMFYGVPKYDFIPYDDEFSPARIHMLLASASEYERWQDEKSRKRYLSDIKRRFLLAESVLKNFPAYPGVEHIKISACRLYTNYDAETTEGLTDFDKAKRCYREFLNLHPQSALADTAQWELLQLETYVYEYEGFADGAVQQANSYEAFLDKYPRNKHREEMLMGLVKSYRIAYECIAFNHNDNKTNFSMRDADLYLNRAIEILQELIQSNTPDVRAKAIVHLYNINNDMIYYLGRNTDW